MSPRRSERRWYRAGRMVIGEAGPGSPTSSKIFRNKVFPKGSKAHGVPCAENGRWAHLGAWQEQQAAGGGEPTS